MSMDNGQPGGPHFVRDEDDAGSDPRSNSSSSPSMFGDASNESQQIHAVEQMEDEIMDAVNNQVDDVSMGTMVTSSSTEPSSIESSWNGEFDELYSELGRADRRQFQRQSVAWQHMETGLYSAVYVCPFSGECFLSGHCIDEVGYARSCGELHWYDSKETAQVAAIKRKIDCCFFRELPVQRDFDPEQIHYHCRDEPYQYTMGQVLPEGIPEQALQIIQFYQRQAQGSSSPSLASTDVSPLTINARYPILRPLEEDTVMTQENFVLTAPLADRNARMVLNERYQGGVINGHYVQNCAIPKSNFLFHEMGASHERYFTYIFVCPLFGELYACGQPAMDQSSAFIMHGLKWFRHKKQAKMYAAARAIDCFEYRQGNVNNVRYCIEEPFSQGNGPALDVRWQRVFSDKIQRLQGEARQRLRRFRHN